MLRDQCFTYRQSVGANGVVTHYKCPGEEATWEVARELAAEHAVTARDESYVVHGHVITRYMLRVDERTLISVEDDTPIPGGLRDMQRREGITSAH